MNSRMQVTRWLTAVLLTVQFLHACLADESQVPRAGEEGVFEGTVLWVTDGDSLRAMVRGANTEIRLADVDAPESDQPHGWKAKLQLIDLVRDRKLTVMPRDVDQYGRIVARVWAGGVDVNRELVKRGAAWFYPQYAEDESLYRVEQQARTEKQGLWMLSLQERVEPWLWRKQQAARAQQRNKERQRENRGARGEQ